MNAWTRYIGLSAESRESVHLPDLISIRHPESADLAHLTITLPCGESRDYACMPMTSERCDCGRLDGRPHYFIAYGPDRYGS